MVAPIASSSTESAQALEDLEIDLLLEGVFRRYGHDFRGYRREPLRRRLHALMQGVGLRTVSALQDKVMHEPGAGAALLHALAVQPVALFEDPAYFRVLRALLTPWLRSVPSPRIWVAECVAAEEVCALSVLLAEEGLQDRTQIFATAANEALLQEASAGDFAPERFAEYAENYRHSGGKADLRDYCSEQGGRMVFGEQLRSNIVWAQYSLATDASFNEFQLITCRRAMDDFGTALRHRALQLFHDSMPVLGILGLGQCDALAAPSFSGRYKPLSAETGLFQRVA